ncbi:MAG TPA: hypothetical protein VGB92_03335 [Longimicrobium sp.]|jgi:hypothetical protein
MRDIPESDWKLFRTVREAALDRYCARVLEESAAILADERETNHERYIRLFRLLAKRDRTLADTFNNPRRSVARIQLAQMDALGLVTDIELARFSSDTRESVRLIRSAW